jgi:uncharacterized protein
VNIVLDTNVLVSGLLTPEGPPGRVVDLVTGLVLTVFYDDRVLNEYRDVLERPRLRIDPAESAALVELIENEGVLISGLPLDIELPDIDDLPFLEVAAAGGVDALVTGNFRHFKPRRGSHRVTVMTPADFLDAFAQRGERP